jgi:VWFA-related protein
VLGLSSLLVFGQDEGGGPRSIGGLTFVDEVELTIVNVMVHVRDKSGEVVTDLTKEDFVLFQDGDPKPITNFQLYTEELYAGYVPPEVTSPLEEPETDEAAVDTEDLEPRPIYIVLYIDNRNLHPIERNRALSQMRAWVREHLRPPVQMMVITYDRSLEILQPFTSEPRKILDAVREVRSATGGRAVLDTERDRILDLLQRLQEEAGSTGSGARSTREYQHILGEVLTFADSENTDLVFSIQALRDTIGVVAGLPGEKSIFYVSNGMPMIAGMGLMSAMSASYQDHAILNNVGRYDRSNLYHSLVEAANSQGVTFYTVGVGGLEVDTMTGADVRSAKDPFSAARGADNYLDSMRYMANETGGIAILNTNDISLGLDRIKSRLFSYYSLGYALNTSGADKVHRIKVELPNHPEYSVDYRRRVVEKSHQTRTQERVISGLMFDLDDNPMGIQVGVEAAGPAAEDTWLVPIHISFDLQTVALLPQGEDLVGNLTLFIAARSNNGKQSDLVRQEHEVRVPADLYDGPPSGRFGINVRMLMKEGSYRVSVGMMDQLTRQSSYRTFATSVTTP